MFVFIKICVISRVNQILILKQLFSLIFTQFYLLMQWGKISICAQIHAFIFFFDRLILNWARITNPLKVKTLRSITNLNGSQFKVKTPVRILPQLCTSLMFYSEWVGEKQIYNLPYIPYEYIFSFTNVE